MGLSRASTQIYKDIRDYSRAHPITGPSSNSSVVSARYRKGVGP